MLNVARLERLLEEKRNAHRIPGMAFAIVSGHEILYTRGFGVANAEEGGPPVTPHTLFRIGSITKPLTGTAILCLVERGLLDLDTPIRDYIPGFSLRDEQAARQITLRMLLKHTAGLPTDLAEFGRRDPNALRQFVEEHLSQYPLFAPPGRIFSYSNPGLNLAGYVAEVVTGKPYAALMQEFVFDPLRMQRTTFDLTTAITFPVAQSHDLDSEGVLHVQHRFADNPRDYPSGLGMSTAADLCHFAMMQMNGGRFEETQVLSPASVAEMQREQVTIPHSASWSYGLTFHLESYKGQRRVYHTGSINTYGSRIDMLPDAQVAVVLLMNRYKEFRNEAVPLIDEIFDQFLALSHSLQPVTRPGDQSNASLLSLVSGTYLGLQRGLAEITTSEGAVTLNWNGETITLTAWSDAVYTGYAAESQREVEVGFVREEDGSVRYILLNTFVCERISRDADFIPSPESLQACAGRYQRDNETVTVRVEEDRLTLWNDPNEPLHCISLSGNRFCCHWGVLDFEPDEAGTMQRLHLAQIRTYIRIE